MALIVATFLRLKDEGFVLSRDLIIAFSGDEETDMATTRSLVGEHRALLRDPEFALNADGGLGVLDETTGEAAVYYVQGAESSTRLTRSPFAIPVVTAPTRESITRSTSWPMRLRPCRPIGFP